MNLIHDTTVRVSHSLLSLSVHLYRSVYKTHLSLREGRSKRLRLRTKRGDVVLKYKDSGGTSRRDQELSFTFLTIKVTEGSKYQIGDTSNPSRSRTSLLFFQFIEISSTDRGSKNPMVFTLLLKNSFLFLERNLL